MRYAALAADYDGTLAHDGQVDQPTIDALKRLRQNGRRLLIVTGRELDDLLRVCTCIELFDLVVAENGALLYRPADKHEQVLGEAPPAAFVAELQARGVAPLSVGRSIVATWRPHETTVLELIRELGLELQVIFNKGAVMILPAGVNKASGLAAALASLRLSPHNVVGIGDAENDHAFLAMCECGVAVANALPMLKQRADWVTSAAHGAGVRELIEALLNHDLERFDGQLQRHWIPLGQSVDGQEQRFSPYASNLLISGSSGSGKSTFATALLDQLVQRGYQCCIIDPEGDYDNYEHAAVLGDPEHEPTIDQLLDLLARPEQHVVVNLLGIALADRPGFCERLLPALETLRSQTGRPHWIVLDEAHHMLRADSDRDRLPIPRQPHAMLYITVHPDQTADNVLKTIDQLVIVGEEPAQTLQTFCRSIGEAVPPEIPARLQRGEVLFWPRAAGSNPQRLRAIQPTSEHKRHIRKYAEGDMQERSFFFRGPEGKLNLRAQNLMLFVQIADGVDDETWLYHLVRGDYARWFVDMVHDQELARHAEALAAESNPDPRQSRAALRAAIEQRYTAPAH